MANRLKRLLRHLPALIGVGLLCGALFVVQREFRSLKLADIEVALAAIPHRALAISFLWTLLSYFILTFYDRLGTIYAGHKVSYGRVAFASFCAYALSHNLGFAAVSGAAVRYRLYAHWGLTPLQIAKTVAFCSLTFALGGLVLGGFVLFIEPTTVPFFGDRTPAIVMYAIGAGLWAVVAAYVTLSKVVGTITMFGNRVELPGWKMAILQVMLASVDVAVTASIFYSLLPAVEGLTWLRFLGAYLASYTAGLATNLPGGIGVFDTAMLLGLSPWMDAPRIVGAIVVFRLYYYIIPLFLAGTMFAGNEILLRGGLLFRRAGHLSGVQAIGRWSEPDFPVAVATGVVVLCGVMLLTLGVVSPVPDFSWIDPDFSGVAAEAGQFVPSLIGAGLLVLAIGLSRRVNLAWGATIVLLMIGAAFIAAQALTPQIWMAGVLILAALVLAPFKESFYRHAKLFRGKLRPATALSLLALAVCVIVLAISERNLRLNPDAGWADDSWWQIVLSSDAPNSLRINIAATVAVALIALWRLQTPAHVTWQPWGPEARARLSRLGALPPGGADGIIWGEAEFAAIPFRRLGRVMLGLGDPIGAESDKVSAIWRLHDLALEEGLDPAVWNAGPLLLKVYRDLGMTALPLNSEGQPLPEAEGETPQSDHYLVCIAERDLTQLLSLLPELARSL